MCDTMKKATVILDAKKDIPKLRHIVLVEEADDPFKTLAAEKEVAIYQLKDIEESGKRNPWALLLPEPSYLATICFTSGTTGEPKGVMLTHGQIIIGADGIRRNIGIDYLGVGDRLISYLPLAHVYEKLCEVLMYSSGGSVGFSRGNNKLLFEDISALKPTFFPGVPRVFNGVFDRVQNQYNWNPVKKLLLNIALSAKQAELDSGIIRDDSMWDRFVLKDIRNIMGGEVRLIMNSASPLRKGVLSFLRCCMGCPVIECYGQTEACGISTSVIGDNRAGTVGAPCPCWFVKLVDVPEMEYFASTNKGEILVKGPLNTKGYFRDPVRTAETIDEDGWIHTGDIGQWSENGALSIIDRKKHILKLSFGEHVSAEKIQNIYLGCPYIEQIFVDGDPFESYLVAIAVPNEEELLALCSELNINGNWNDICENKVIKAYILKTINELGKKEGLTSIEQVKAIHLHPEFFTVQNGLLTDTLKLKRENLKQTFKNIMSGLYREHRNQ